VPEYTPEEVQRVLEDYANFKKWALRRHWDINKTLTEMNREFTEDELEIIGYHDP
jgi:hypothetical protein